LIENLTAQIEELKSELRDAESIVKITVNRNMEAMYELSARRSDMERNRHDFTKKLGQFERASILGSDANQYLNAQKSVNEMRLYQDALAHSRAYHNAAMNQASGAGPLITAGGSGGGYISTSGPLLNSAAPESPGGSQQGIWSKLFGTIKE